MVVLSQSCLPLTCCLLPNLTEPETQEFKVSSRSQFLEVCRILVVSVRKGLPLKEGISWTYKYDSLWSPRLRDTRGYRINLWKCSKESFIGLLRTRTYWFKRLSSSCRQKVKLMAREPNSRRLLRDILHTADGVLVSLLLSFPELFEREGYALADRINNSVISNCLHNYSRFQKKLKLLRKTIRSCALSKKEIPLDLNGLRDMSYFVRPIQILNEYKDKSSKEKVFRIATLTQTRATGLAGADQVKEAIQDFLDTVTVKREYRPNELLNRCIDQVTSFLADQIYVGTNSEFKISMSTSACRECPKRKEGKFGFLKDLVRGAEVKIPPLSDGIPGTLGNWLWKEAAQQLTLNKAEVMKVNVAAVRENGKARVITSGSFWKDAALQPFSHITIHLLKILPNLCSSLQAGRLGWKYIEKVIDEKDSDTRWIFDRHKKWCYTTDWKKATDAPPPEAAWALTGKLLEKTGLDEHSLNIVKEYWLGKKTLMIRGKPVGTLINGVPMGDPLTKSNVSLAHPVCDLYARTKTGCRSFEEGNGDDTTAIIDNPEYAPAYRECAEMLGYEISWLDELITEDWGIYSEEYFHIPVSGVNTCRNGTRFKKTALLPYLDVPKIRALIGTEKDRVDYSSDPRGKVTLLGHDQEYFKDDGPHHAIFAIASGIQDVCLATIDNPVPLFLPRQVNGVGKPPPYWKVDSWENIMDNCPKWHQKYYLTAMKELNDGLQGITGYRGALKESNHFDKEMLVELYEIPKDDPIRRYIAVHSDQWDEWPAGVLLKLVTLGYLVPERKIAKYYLFQERLEQLEQDTKRDLFEVVRCKMAEYPDIEPTNRRDIIRKFKKNFFDSPYQMRARGTENLYHAAAINKLESGNPLYVDHSYPLIKKFRKRIRPNTRYERLGAELFQWFMRTFIARTKGLDEERPPRDILEDDPLIIQELGEGGADIFVIVTDDVRLFRLALNKYPEQYICRMSCVHFLQTNTFVMEETDDNYDDALEEVFVNEYGPLTVTSIVDTGSVDAWMNKYHPVADGTYFQTEGIPWRKNIKKENLERKPFHGFISAPSKKSMKDLAFPRSLMRPEEHQLLKSRRPPRPPHR